jgi:hypothetical protein
MIVLVPRFHADRFGAFELKFVAHEVIAGADFFIEQTRIVLHQIGTPGAGFAALGSQRSMRRCRCAV